MGLLSSLQQDIGRCLFLPAHGRGAALPNSLRRLLQRRAGSWDLPELPHIGGPLESEGAVAEAQQQAAECVGAQRAWFGVNGATGLLQSALLAITRPGQAVLMPRNAHRSLLQACLLGELTPVLFDLPFLNDRGQAAPLDAEWLIDVLGALPLPTKAIAAAVLVHPTYQGYAGDLKPLIHLLHKQGWPVLVDEAHGSHFLTDVDPMLPRSALHGGADLVVHSLQKSAAGLAQTAVLWHQGDRVDPIRVERSMGWLQTTSPSALLLASCVSALNEWQLPQGRRRLKRRLDDARHLATRLRRSGLPLLSNQDPLRMVLHTGSIGISGLDADAWWMPRGLIAELPEPATVTFCLGLAKHRGLEQQLRKAWGSLRSAHPDRVAQAPFEPAPLPLVGMPDTSLAMAWRAESEAVPLVAAEGRIAAELVCPYPPGIPLLVPGERLDRQRLDWLQRQRILWGDQLPERIRVVRASHPAHETVDAIG